MYLDRQIMTTRVDQDQAWRLIGPTLFATYSAFLRNHKQQNGLVEEKDYGKERRCENFGYHDMYTLLNLSKILHENEILRQSGPDRTSHCIAQRSLVELFML